MNNYACEFLKEKKDNEKTNKKKKRKQSENEVTTQ